MEVSAQQVHNKLSLVLLIILNTSFVFAQNPSTQVEIDFSKVQGVSAGKETFTLELKGSKVDVSPILERIEILINQSNYQNLPFMNSFASNLNDVKNKIRDLCSNLIQIQHEYECEGSAQEDVYDHFSNIFFRSQKFLYPDNYHPIGTLPSKTIQKANTTTCCYDENVAKTLLYGSSSQHSQIVNKLKDLGTPCLKQASHAVIENLQSHTAFERPDHQSFCRYITNRDDKDRCNRLQNDYKIIQERITSLTNLIRENETPLTHRSSACLETIASNNSLTCWVEWLVTQPNPRYHPSCAINAIGGR